MMKPISKFWKDRLTPWLLESSKDFLKFRSGSEHFVGVCLCED